MTLESLNAEVINSRRLFRYHRIKTSRLLEIGVWSMDPSQQPTKEELESKMREVYQQTYGFDPLTIMILGVILSALAQLLVYWFQKHYMELPGLKVECTNIQTILATGWKGDGTDPDNCSIPITELQNDPN